MTLIGMLPAAKKVNVSDSVHIQIMGEFSLLSPFPIYVLDVDAFNAGFIA